MFLMFFDQQKKRFAAQHKSFFMIWSCLFREGMKNEVFTEYGKNHCGVDDFF